MLTLLLVLGAVTCSPVPSDLPALPGAAHVEVTHEVRHVTYEVSEEVNEATASSQIPSDVPPEEDPPIPTVTTPHTAPEEQHPQDDVTESHVAPQPLEPAGDISQEASAESKVTEEETLHEERHSSEEETLPEERHSSEEKTEIESEEKDEALTDSEVTNIKSEEKLDAFTDSEGTEVESEEKHEALAESKVIETENVSESEKSQETVEIVSSESIEFVPESHIFLSNEGTNDSQPDSQLEGTAEPVQVVHIDTSAAIPTGEELAVSASSTEVVAEVAESTLSEQEEKNGEVIVVEQTDIEENTDPADKEAVSEVVSQTGDVEENVDITVQAHDAASDEAHVGGGELLEVVPSQSFNEPAGSEFLKTEKRTDNEDLPVHRGAVGEPPVSESSEVVALMAPEENVPETTRESRVYIEYEDEPDDPQEAKDGKGHSVSESKPANKGLESMSMTSPTPESLNGDVPVVDDLEKEEAPPAEDQEEETVTVIPEMDSQEENSTLITNVQDPDVVPEVVINTPSSSVSPLPIEEYTDNYSDPIAFGDLPDFDVTHEHLPSKEYPLSEEAQLIPEQTHDHVGEVSEGESSDLAAGDHMLEVEAGTPRVLPPQQEQVSAAAPSSLTPGCIVAIVFGVLVSLVVILGVGGFMIWQRRTQNRPKVLGSDQGYAGSDSGGYIDDQVRVSYVNSQTDTPKGSPEDLISLDNDSFLNSLESMTIQNLWTDNIRHTKL